MKRVFLPLLISLVSSASAQVFEVGMHGGVSRLSKEGKDLGIYEGSQVSLADGWRFGFRTTLNNWKYMGHEFGYGYNRTKLTIGTDYSQGMAIHTAFYNFLVYATPEESRVRPFVAGGGHFSNFVPPGASATQGQGQNKFGYNYGGGVKVRVKTNWGFRLDYRQYITGKPDFDAFLPSGKIRQTEISAGFMFML